MSFWSALRALFLGSRSPSPPAPSPLPAPSPSPAPPSRPAYGAPLSQAGLEAAESRLGVGAAELWAVIAVETPGFGFHPNKLPQILFERHIFSRETSGRFDASDPDISNPSAGGYLGKLAEYDRLRKAAGLDLEAALKSASWGLGQVMGFNAPNLEYPSVSAFVERMRRSEDEQLEAMARFIIVNDLAPFLRARDWRSFARRYNGPRFADHRYDTRLAAQFARFSSGPQPDLTIRAAQLYLTYLGHDPEGIDGALGARTRAALGAFLRSRGEPSPPAGPDRLDARLYALLEEAARAVAPAWPLPALG